MTDVYEKIEQNEEIEETGQYCIYAPMPVYCETKNCKLCEFYKNEQ